MQLGHLSTPFETRHPNVLPLPALFYFTSPLESDEFVMMSYYHLPVAGPRKMDTSETQSDACDARID